MRAIFASATVAGALVAGCQLSLDLDHTFHTDAGDGLGGAFGTSQGGGDGVVAPSGGQGGAAGSAAPSGISGTSGVLGGSGGAGTYMPNAGSDSGGSNAAGGSGGASGTGGTDAAGSGGSGGTTPQPPVTCSGCVELIVPVSTTGDKAVFEFQFDDAPVDLSDAIITWRVQAVNETAGDWADSAFMVLKAYAQSRPPPGSNPPGYFTDELKLSLENFEPGVWRDLMIDVASFPDAELPNDFNKTAALRIGLELAAGSNFFGTHSIRVFVDSVRFEGVPSLSDRSFDTELEGFVLNTYEVPMSTRLETHFEP